MLLGVPSAAWASAMSTACVNAHTPNCALICPDLVMQKLKGVDGPASRCSAEGDLSSCSRRCRGAGSADEGHRPQQLQQPL